MSAEPDIDAVTTLIQECADELMLPWFGRLRPEDIEAKANVADPQDLVTIVDRQVEARLTRAFEAMVPGSIVVGEEATHSAPHLLGAISTDQPLWLLDPLDGTRYFARGDDGFGIIVGWATGGEVRAAWILLPARREMWVAEASSGAFRNGLAVKVPTAGLDHPHRGSVSARFMPNDVGDSALRATAGRFRDMPKSSCAVEYTEIVAGRREFAVYYRLLPWDHAAPALVLREGGGRVEHLDGRPYGLRSANAVTVVARDGLVSAEVREWLSLA